MEIFVFGCGGHAKVVSDVIEATGAWRIAGYVEVAPTAARFLDHRVLDEESFLAAHRGAEVALAVGDNARRKAIQQACAEAFSFPIIVHPSAVLAASCSIGPGTVVMPGVVINAQARVGDFCVINSAAVIEHDCRLGNFVTVAPRGCVCGACALGEGSYVGAGATVIQDVTLGPWSLVGAGGVVCRNVEANTLVAGVPAKPKRRVPVGELVV